MSIGRLVPAMTTAETSPAAQFWKKQPAVAEARRLVEFESMRAIVGSQTVAPTRCRSRSV